MSPASRAGLNPERPQRAMKLACPSWVIPGTWAENLDFILSRPENPVDGVELLVFDFDEATRAALRTDLAAIGRATGRTAGRVAGSLELSVHLPSRVGPGTLELVDMLKEYARLFIVHPPKPGDEEDFIAFMLAATGSSTDSTGVPGQGGEAGACAGSPVFALEYTNCTDFARGLDVLDVLDAAGILSSTFPVCMDTGHLLLEGRDPAEFARWAGDRLVRIHLHDVVTGPDGKKRDHAALVPGSAWLARLFPALRNFGGFVELELFDWAAVVASAKLLKTMETAPAVPAPNQIGDPAADSIQYQ